MLSAAGLLAIALAAPHWLSQTWAGARRNLTETLEQIQRASAAPDPKLLLDVRPAALVESIAGPVVTLSAAVVAAVVVAGLAQTRGVTVIGDKDTRPRSPQARSGLGLLLPAGLLVIGTIVVIDHLTLWTTPALLGSPGWTAFGALLGRLALASVPVALALGIVDLWWRKARWQKRNEGTPAEQRREQRQREVAPEVRAVQREIYREMARGES